jgi:hypothetical protein
LAREYHVDIARFAANADQKWVDNLLSHYDVPGVEGARQGQARRITHVGVQHIALIRALTLEPVLKVGAAVSLSVRLLAPETDGVVEICSGVELRLDRAEFARTVDAAIGEAVEAVAPARRGRPKKA